MNFVPNNSNDREMQVLKDNREFEPIYIINVTRHYRRTLVFPWALPKILFHFLGFCFCSYNAYGNLSKHHCWKITKINNMQGKG